MELLKYCKMCNFCVGEKEGKSREDKKKNGIEMKKYK